MITLLWLYLGTNFVLSVLSWVEDARHRKVIGIPQEKLHIDLATVVVLTFLFMPIMVLENTPSHHKAKMRVCLMLLGAGLAGLVATDARADEPTREVIPNYNLVYIETVLPHVVCFMLVHVETGEPRQMSCTLAPSAPITPPPRSERWTPTAATTTLHW